MIRRRDSIQEIRFVAERLGLLLDRVVFVGGATVGLLITEPGGAPPRPTDDVDVAIDVTSTIEYLGELRDELSRLGFRQEIGVGFCRWMMEQTPVDIMPADEAILGFSNRWYQATFAHADRYNFPDGPTIRLISPPCFLATKLQALSSRGHADYLDNKDLEDIVSVVDGRPAIVEELDAAPGEIRSYVASELARYLTDDVFLEALSAHLVGDTVSQARRPRLVACLEQISRRFRTGGT